MAVILGIASKNADSRKRNIGIDLKGLDTENIELLSLMLIIHSENIKQYVERIQRENDSNNIYTSWKMNEDCSVAILFEGDFPFITPYVEYAIQEEINGTHLRKTVKVSFTTHRNTLLSPEIKNLMKS